MPACVHTQHTNTKLNTKLNSRLTFFLLVSTLSLVCLLVHELTRLDSLFDFASLTLVALTFDLIGSSSLNPHSLTVSDAGGLKF